MMKDIDHFLCCETCIRWHNRRGIYSVGLSGNQTLVVWCDLCDREVGRFTLKTPLDVTCEVCDDLPKGAA